MLRRSILVLTLAIAACVPLRAPAASEPLTLTSAEQENKMGEDTYREILQKEKVCKNKEIVAFVERVAGRIIAAAPDKGFKYEIAVLESPTINAFCLPGGKIAVYTGILPYCQNEAGLATVLGHEVAHAILRHGGQRMTQAAVVDFIGSSMNELLKARGVSTLTSTVAMGAYDASTQLGILLPYSRKHENEADAEGLFYMAKAGYDPAEAPNFWKRFASKGKSGTPAFLSTHPSDEERITRLEKAQPEAQKLYAGSVRMGAGAKLPAGIQAVDLSTQSSATTASTVAPNPAAPAPAPAATKAESFSLSSLAEAEIRKGLQEALSTGMKNAIAKLGKADGYFKDEAVKVLMPEKLKDLEKMVRMVGKGKQADEFIENMNRAAEKAAPATADILATAIASLTVTDARGIAKGKKDEATQYFIKTCDASLQEKLLPLVSKATSDAGATKSYKDLIKKAGFAGRALVGDFDLDAYITRKAVDGLYLKMSEEEQKIRANPAGQASDILRKVFGAKKD
ncbi:MAG: DUF4197 family protein [Planctomycetota bacterium]|nr:DUF4197 family protein [Planctomycetota bacterium]